MAEVQPIAEDTLFRDRAEPEAPVTSAELFFDLVFVFAVTQVSHFLLHHLDWLGALEAVFLLLAVWSCWIDTVLITNLLDPARQPVRLVLFVLMAVGLVFAAALPSAFNDGGLIFAVAFATFQLGRTVFIAWATRSRPFYFRHFARMAIWVVVYDAFWIAGGILDGPARFACWAVALLLDYAVPTTGYFVPGLGRTDLQVLEIEGGHVAERTNLFVMIALGESVLVTGATFADQNWTPEAILAVASGLLSGMAMWWIYFYWSADLAKDVIARARDPSRFILRAFGYVPWIVVAGIVTSAVGDDLTLGEPHDTPSPAVTCVLIGGAALFLFGALLFEEGALGKWSRIRFAGLAATLLLIPIAPHCSVLILSGLTTTILVGVAAAEHIWINRKRTGNKHPASG